jgi:hypothetical protein
MGISNGLLITALVYSLKFDLKTISLEFFWTLVAGVGISALLLFYGVWGSIWGGKCPKILLSFFYLLYALGIGALGIVILVLQSKIVEKVGELFESKSEFAETLENLTNCEGWNVSSENDCQTMVEKFYDTVGKGIAIGLMVLCVILVVGDGFAWKWTVGRKEGYVRTKAESSLSAPLRYSW